MHDEITSLVREFQRYWENGEQPSVKTFFSRVKDEERSQLVQSIVPVDLRWRSQDSIRSAKAEYYDAAPESKELIDHLIAVHVGVVDSNEATHHSSGLSQTVNEITLEHTLRSPENDVDGHTLTANAVERIAVGRVGVPRSRFGDYELVEEIGRGGMGVVFKAKQLGLNRMIALKTILAPHLAGPDQILRFRREAEAAAKLDHSGIVSVYDSGTVQDTHYFSMAYIEGGSLSDLLKNGPMNQIEAARLIVTIADAVDYAHRQGVVHRDLKPSNVLLNRDGDPLVADFGLAKIMSLDSEATVSGRILGTPSYMAPEQASGKTSEVGPHSDIYAIGAILYRMLTGRPPFQEDTPSSTVRAVLDQDVVPPRKMRRGIHRDLETICLKCLEKEPADRYRSAGELAVDAQHFLNDEPIKAQPVGVIRSIWRWYTGRRDSSAQVAGGYAIIAGLILMIWNVMGLVAVSLQSSYDETRHNALAEIASGLFGQSIPTVVVGWYTLKRKRWALYGGALVTISAVCFTFWLYVGLTELNSIKSRPFDAQSALLLIISAIAMILYLTAVYALRKRNLRTSDLNHLPST